MERDMGLRRLAQPVSFSICGEAGRHAFIVPSRDSLRLRWCQSSSTSTTHLLAITALAHCYHRLEVERSRHQMWLRVISWYTTVFGKDHNQVTEPPATFPIIILWCLIQIALNIGNVVKTDKMVRTNGAPLGFLDRNQGYVKPALLPLAATWGHWQYDIQRVARAHLQV